MFFSLSSDSHLEVKWANVHRGNRQFYRSPHRNPHYNLIVVADGPVYIELDGTPLTLQAGEYLLAAPWQEHQGWKPMADHAGFFWLQFSSDRELRMIDDKPSEDDFHLLMPDSNELRTSSSDPVRLLIPQRMALQERFELMVLFEKLLRELDRPRGYFRVRLSVLLWTMIERIADETLRSRHPDASLSASFLTYRRIVNLLEETYTEERNKEFYEEALDLKYEYVCNVFKKYSGTTVTSYLLFLRMQQARDMLRRTDKPIQQIAREVGYEDPYYFSKLFKKTNGTTPTNYREEVRR